MKDLLSLSLLSLSLVALLGTVVAQRTTREDSNPPAINLSTQNDQVPASYETSTRQPSGETVYFDRLPATDLYGGDLSSSSGLSLAECEAACAADPNCKSATHKAASGGCWLKDAVPRKTAVIGLTSVVRLEFIQHPDTDLPGYTVGSFVTTGSAEYCQSACADNPDCKAYTFVPAVLEELGACRLKSKPSGALLPAQLASAGSHEPGSVSGRKLTIEEAAQERQTALNPDTCGTGTLASSADEEVVGLEVSAQEPANTSARACAVP